MSATVVAHHPDCLDHGSDSIFDFCICCGLTDAMRATLVDGILVGPHRPEDTRVFGIIYQREGVDAPYVSCDWVDPYAVITMTRALDLDTLAPQAMNQPISKAAAWAAMLAAVRALVDHGQEYAPLLNCKPPGLPVFHVHQRWGGGEIKTRVKVRILDATLMARKVLPDSGDVAAEIARISKGVKS